jgi:hypothetical protein
MTVSKIRKILNIRLPGVFAWALAAAMLISSKAYATDVSEISENIVTSGELLPGLVTGLSYMLGTILGVVAVLKLKEHVENPNKENLKNVLGYGGAGGALFSLPMIYEAMKRTIGWDDPGVDSQSDVGSSLSSFFQPIYGTGDSDFNQVIENIAESFTDVPGLLTGGAYLLGLVLGVMGILKLKEHIENPENLPLREGVIRLLIGGALFALPTVFAAVYETVNGGAMSGFLSSIVTGSGVEISPEEGGVACDVASTTIGGVICNLMFHTGNFPKFLAAFCYLGGLIMTIWAILKVKDHVLNPQQTGVWEAATRFLIGGALFAIPTILNAAANSVALDVDPHSNTGFNNLDGGGAGGLDSVVARLMENILGPANIIFIWFSLAAGMVLIIIAVFRLMKSAQEGVKGPGGIGTIMTFIVGGALITLNPMIGALSMSLFEDTSSFTYATLNYTAGMTAEELEHVYRVISAVLAFMIMIGWVSIIRGFFILRSVSDGKQDASMMAAVTHIIGGAVAINLGPMLNAVQETLGITNYGLTFS